MARMAVIINPTKPGQEEVRAAVARAERAAGWQPSLWLPTTADDPGLGMARSAVAAGVDGVLVVGGDGTVRAATEGLRRRNVPMAICPKGTGNLLAWNLGLPLADVQASVDTAFSGTRRMIDLVVANLERPDGTQTEITFAVMAGIGLDAQIMSKTDDALKARVGMLAYIHTGAVEVARSRRMHVRYRVDGAPGRRVRAQMVLVGNCGSIGHNVFVMPDAELEDGLLDLLLAKPATLVGWAVVAWRVVVDHALMRRLRRRGVRRNDSVMSTLQGTRVALRLEEAEEFEVDGDSVGVIMAASFRVDPGSLAVMVPDL